MVLMFRKFIKEYYGGKFGGSEKRLFFVFSQDSSIRSFGFDMLSFIQYFGMKEVEFYSSVVIYFYENFMFFGRDYAELKFSISDLRQDVFGFESERGFVLELRFKLMRYGFDFLLYFLKYFLYMIGSRFDLNRE